MWYVDYDNLIITKTKPKRVYSSHSLKKDAEFSLSLLKDMVWGTSFIPSVY